MASPPQIATFNREDFPAQAEWIDKLFRPLNLLSSGTFKALNKGLTFADNFVATLKELKVSAPDMPWHEIGATGEPAFQNSWVALGGTNSTAAYRIVPGGNVELKGSVKDGTANTTIFTLAAGHRPNKDFKFASTSAAAFAEVTVSTNGNVAQGAGATTSLRLDGITFPVTANGSSPLKFTVASNGVGWPIFFAHDLVSACRALIPVSARIKDVGPNDSVGQFTVDWEDTGDGRVKIKSMYGLIPGVQYFITFLCLAG